MKALLVDDHALFREGLELLVQQRLPQLQLLSAGNFATALDLVRRHADCALALLDLNLPDSTGLSALERLRDAAPSLPVVVVSADDRPETVLSAIDRGAAGFIAKKADGDALIGALRNVLEGGVCLPLHLLSKHALAATDIGQMAPLDPAEELGLSPRQLDVLRLLLKGCANKMIQRELDMAESTVKTHLQAIFRRLGVSSRTQAVVAAARLGLKLADEGAPAA